MVKQWRAALHPHVKATGQWATKLDGPDWLSSIGDQLAARATGKSPSRRSRVAAKGRKVRSTAAKAQRPGFVARLDQQAVARGMAPAAKRTPAKKTVPQAAPDVKPARKAAKAAAPKVSKATPLSRAHYEALQIAQEHGGVPGPVMSKTTRDALVSKGLLRQDGGNYQITDAGRAALASQAPKAPTDYEDLARRVRHRGDEQGILDELATVPAEDLRKVADELNVSLPPQARSASSKRLHIARTMAESERRTRGGMNGAVQLSAARAGQMTTAEVVDRLKALDRGTTLAEIGTREDAYAIIDGLPKSALVDVARQFNVPRSSSMTAAELRREIADAAIGRRIDSIHTRGFTGPRPEMPGEVVHVRSGPQGQMRQMRAPAERVASGAARAGEMTQTQVDDAIRAAYSSSVRRPGEYVTLAELRKKLPKEISREQADAALVRLNRTPGVTVVAEPNRTQLTQADHAAAVVIGNQPKHAIAMDTVVGRVQAPVSEERLAAVEDAVRRAYSDTTRPGQLATIVDLRRRLDAAGIPRREQDAALIRLNRQPGVTVVPEANQQMLTDADRRDAVMIGNQPKHAIMMNAEEAKPRGIPLTPGTPKVKVTASQVAKMRELDAYRQAPYGSVKRPAVPAAMYRDLETKGLLERSVSGDPILTKAGRDMMAALPETPAAKKPAAAKAARPRAGKLGLDERYAALDTALRRGDKAEISRSAAAISDREFGSLPASRRTVLVEAATVAGDQPLHDRLSRLDVDARRRERMAAERLAAKPMPENPQDRAVWRQANIDRGKRIGSVLAELGDVWANSNGDPAAVDRVLARQERAGTIDPKDAERFRAAARDATLPATLERAAKSAKLTRTSGPAGSVEPYDRARGQTVAGGAPEGGYAAVVRPSYTMADPVGGGVVTVVAGVVEPATPDEIAAARAAAAAAPVKKAGGKATAPYVRKGRVAVVEDAILKSYEAAGGQNTWVSIADVRRRLDAAGIPRHEQDAALASLAKRAGVTVVSGPQVARMRDLEDGKQPEFSGTMFSDLLDKGLVERTAGGRPALTKAGRDMMAAAFGGGKDSATDGVVVVEPNAAAPSGPVERAATDLGKIKDRASVVRYLADVNLSKADTAGLARQLGVEPGPTRTETARRIVDKVTGTATTAAKKAAPRRRSGPVDAAKIKTDLAAINDREQARTYIQGLGLTIPQLVALGDELNIPIARRPTRAAAESALVQWTVGRRTASEAISGIRPGGGASTRSA